MQLPGRKSTFPSEFNFSYISPLNSLNLVLIPGAKLDGHRGTWTGCIELHAFFIGNEFISNARLKLAKNQAKAKQHPEAELLTNMSTKQVCLCQLVYMISCNENEKDNEKTGYINNT